jgi:ubiquinone biosynthesis protein UbiJ
MDPVSNLTIRALNHLIQGEYWAQDRLRAHSGAQVLIDAGGLFKLRLGIDEQGLFTAGNSESDPNVAITLPTDTPVRLLFDRDRLFSAVKLGGSAEIAESFAFVLRNLAWDSESDLAGLIGDIPAHRLLKMARALSSAISDSIDRAAKNAVEYATNESALLATPHRIAEFGNAVNTLRDDLSRLEKRISKL